MKTYFFIFLVFCLNPLNSYASSKSSLIVHAASKITVDCKGSIIVKWPFLNGYDIEIVNIINPYELKASFYYVDNHFMFPHENILHLNIEKLSGAFSPSVKVPFLSPLVSYREGKNYGGVGRIRFKYMDKTYGRFKFSIPYTASGTVYVKQTKKSIAVEPPSAIKWLPLLNKDGSPCQAKVTSL